MEGSSLKMLGHRAGGHETDSLEHLKGDAATLPKEMEDCFMKPTFAIFILDA